MLSHSLLVVLVVLSILLIIDWRNPPLRAGGSYLGPIVVVKTDLWDTSSIRIVECYIETSNRLPRLFSVIFGLGGLRGGSLLDRLPVFLLIFAISLLLVELLDFPHEFLVLFANLLFLFAFPLFSLLDLPLQLFLVRLLLSCFLLSFVHVPIREQASPKGPVGLVAGVGLLAFASQERHEG